VLRTGVADTFSDEEVPTTGAGQQSLGQSGPSGTSEHGAGGSGHAAGHASSSSAAVGLHGGEMAVFGDGASSAESDAERSTTALVR
jgi:hypothetical protein